MRRDKNQLLALLAGIALASAAAGALAQDEGTVAEATPAAGDATAAPAEGDASTASAEGDGDAAAAEGGDLAEVIGGESAVTGVVVKPMPSEIMPLAPRSLLLDVFNTGKHLIAVGDRGHILASNDGKNWAQVQVPVRSALTAVHFPDPQNGWAVGHDATILRTQDGGRTWQLQNFQPELEKPFMDVLFLDARRGFALGAYGLFYETVDGGENWTEVNATVREEELHFNGLTRLNNGNLLVTGEQGMLALSSDGGAMWEKLTSPYESSMFGAVPVGEKGALIFGLRGNVFYSEDPAGGQWKEVQTGTVASMFGGTALPDGRAALVGLNGVVLIVDGQGSGVRSLRAPAGTPLSSVIAVGQGSLLAVGESGVQAVKLQ